MLHWHAIMKGLAGVVFPMMGLLVLGGVLTNLAASRFPVPARSRSAPISAASIPAQGLKRIFSLTGTMRLGFGLFKVHRDQRRRRDGDLVAARRDSPRGALDMRQLGHFLIDISLKTVLWIGLALVILAIFDYGLQRWKHEQDLKMTHQEVREEMKNLQGDPQIVARRRPSSGKWS